MKVSFKTLGCRLNLYETDALASKFVEQGYEVDDDFENSDAEILVINTCTITNQSDKKSREYISRARRKGSLVVVTGCMASQYREAIKDDADIAVIVDNKHKNRIFDIVEARLRGLQLNVEDLDGNVFDYSPAKDTFHTRSIVKIQDGCNNFCTYCIVPYVRGRAISRPVSEVLQNIRDELAFGFKEIVLTGVNISKYNCGGVDFYALVEKILAIEGDFRVRIASIEPDDFSDSFINLFRNPKLAPHIHLCLQSGSDGILKRMHRHYNMEDFSGIVDKFRAVIPDFNFTTDIIVGFPGESDEDFQQTLDAASRIVFGHIHTFKYSRRRGTLADKMPDQVDERIKTARSKVLRDLSEQLTRKNMENMLGKRQRMLSETIDKDGYLYGYGEYYQRIRIKTDNPQVNAFYNVNLVGIDGEVVIGEVIAD